MLDAYVGSNGAPIHSIRRLRSIMSGISAKKGLN